MNLEETKPVDDIKGLTRQFHALKALAISQQKTINHYSQKDFDTNEQRIKALQHSINSEREMNEKLTSENAELEKERDKLLEWQKGVYALSAYLVFHESNSDATMDKAKKLLEKRDLEQRAKGIEDFFKSHEPRISMGKSAIWEVDDVLVDEAIKALKDGE